MNRSSDFERAFLKHHDGRVVNAGSFGEYKDREFVFVFDVFSESSANGHSVVGFGSLEPNVIRGPMQSRLHDAQEAAVLLTDHRVSVVATQNHDVDGSRVVGDANAWVEEKHCTLQSNIAREEKGGRRATARIQGR